MTMDVLPWQGLVRASKADPAGASSCSNQLRLSQIDTERLFHVGEKAIGKFFTFAQAGSE